MKSYKQNLTVNMGEKQGYMDITDDVMSALRCTDIRTGICTISTMHTTASVTTATNDPETLDGYLKFYEKLSSLAKEELRPALCHQLAGNSVSVMIENGELLLGLSQYIIYLDFDGERDKTVSISILGE